MNSFFELILNDARKGNYRHVALALSGMKEQSVKEFWNAFQQSELFNDDTVQKSIDSEIRQLDRNLKEAYKNSIISKTVKEINVVDKTQIKLLMTDGSCFIFDAVYSEFDYSPELEYDMENVTFDRTGPSIQRPIVESPSLSELMCKQQAKLKT